MKKLIAVFTLLAMLCGLTAPAFAEDAAAPAAAASAAVEAAAPAAVADAAKPAEAPAAAPAPSPNKGDTAWMLTATLLVIRFLFLRKIAHKDFLNFLISCFL